MKFGSLFSGIGGFDLGFERAGMECAWQCEIDRAARSILRKQFPHAELHTDVSKLSRPTPVDVLCGGFPCQDLSVAGRRAGLAGARSGLWHEFRRIAGEIEPSVIVIENVPGLLSSNDGQDFGVLLSGLEQLGYRWAYRILDSQYDGVAQRRRRVFIVGSLGNGRCAEILFESESLRWDFAPSRKAGEKPAPTLGCGPVSGGRKYGTDADTCESLVVGGYRPGSFGNWVEGVGTLSVKSGGSCGQGGSECLITGTMRSNGDAHSGFELADGLIAFDTTQITSRENRSNPQEGDPCHPLASGAHPPAIAYRTSPNCGAWETGERTDALTTGTDPSATVVHCLQGAGRTSQGSQGSGWKSNTAFTLNRTDEHAVAYSGGVRRLTPRECERLQGFPDDWTRWTDTGKEQADGPRYKQLGNAVTVTVAEWLGTRISLACKQRKS